MGTKTQYFIVVYFFKEGLFFWNFDYYLDKLNFSQLIVIFNLYFICFAFGSLMNSFNIFLHIVSIDHLFFTLIPNMFSFEFQERFILFSILFLWMIDSKRRQNRIYFPHEYIYCNSLNQKYLTFVFHFDHKYDSIRVSRKLNSIFNQI